MDIIVCIKQVPSPEHFSKITIDPQTGTIRRSGIPTVMNPLDKHAIEEALRIREKFSGKITAISMGPPQAREVLEEALAMGADDAVLLCSPAFAGADTLATAYPLAGAIKKTGKFDLIFCGNETVDGATGQVGPQIAELLDIPHISYVTKVEFSGSDSLIVTRSIEHGHLKIKSGLPVLLAVARKINQYRLPTVLAIMEAAGKEISTWTEQDIGLSSDAVGLTGSPTRVVGCFELTSKRKKRDFARSA
ncbi:MAG: electron transfer flavoprotein subunit beta/FixA family protein [Smithellaceae bacterium]